MSGYGRQSFEENSCHFDCFLIKLFRLTTKHINEREQILKVLSFVGMLMILAIAMNMAAGLDAFLGINSIVIVFGGGALYWLAAGGIDQTRSPGLDNYGTGAVYFGWLGLAIGVIGMAGSWANIDPNALGPASAIAMLPPLYGYLIAWAAVPAIKSLAQDG